MRIAFAGTPEFAKIQLDALLSTSHEVVVIYTQPDKPAGRGQQFQISPVKQCALAHSLPVEQPTTLKTAEALNILARYHVDLMVVAAYGMILPDPILKLPRFGCVNVHASLLPRWRGASPIQQAILAGDQETGITLMQMDKGLDTGAILAQASCVITPQDTTSTLHDKLASLGADLLVKELDHLTTLSPQPQDETFVTYAHKIHKHDAHLSWSLPALQLERQIRAFNSWPIAFTEMEGQIVRLWEAKVIPDKSHAAPGTIIAHTPQGILVTTGQEALLITKAQLAGKKVMPFSEILKGHASLFAVGKKLI